MMKKFLQSAFVNLPLPSAMLAEIERAARLSWSTTNSTPLFIVLLAETSISHVESSSFGVR